MPSSAASASRRPAAELGPRCDRNCRWTSMEAAGCGRELRGPAAKTGWGEVVAAGSMPARTRSGSLSMPVRPWQLPPRALIGCGIGGKVRPPFKEPDAAFSAPAGKESALHGHTARHGHTESRVHPPAFRESPAPDWRGKDASPFLPPFGLKSVTHVSGLDRKEMAGPEGLEPPTCWFEARRSIRLSYGPALPPLYQPSSVSPSGSKSA